MDEAEIRRKDIYKQEAKMKIGNGEICKYGRDGEESDILKLNLKALPMIFIIS